jgi:hypothetical protein
MRKAIFQISTHPNPPIKYTPIGQDLLSPLAACPPVADSHRAQAARGTRAKVLVLVRGTRRKLPGLSGRISFFVSQPRHCGPRTKTKGTGYGSAPIRDRGAPLLLVRRKTRNYKSFFEKIVKWPPAGTRVYGKNGQPRGACPHS